MRKEVLDIFRHKGVCYTFAKIGLAEARLVDERAVLLSKNCHEDTTIRAEEYPLPLKVAEGDTVKLIFDM